MKRNRSRTKKPIDLLVSAVIAGAPTTEVKTLLNRNGFPLPATVTESFVTIAKRLSEFDDGRHLTATLTALSQSPDPMGAMINFIRYVETTGTPSALNAISSGGPILEILATVFGASQYMSDIIIRNPGYLHWLIERSTWEREDTRDELLQDLRTSVSNFQSLDTRLGGVRRFQRRALLKIGVQDLLGLLSVEDTARGLSRLGDAIIEGVLEIILDELGIGPAAFSVLALGKLGGEELNYSSDIDLIYICDDVDDSTVETLHRLARRITTALSDVTAEGYLYRVDLRLRPDGDVGPLVSPLSSLMVYYENRGRPWEFQAMLKARVVAGDRPLGNGFLEKIRALAFNPTLSYSPREAISLMRSRIQKSISTRDRSFNIKLMEGGIRDIEFMLQAIQLMHGARRPELRGTNTTEGLELAGKEQLLTNVEQQTLVGAYRFFRLVEHRLQMMHQLKTHSIPESPAEIELLARRVSCGPLGSFTRTQFLKQLTTYIHKVRVLSESFFEGDALPDETLLLLLPEGHDTVEETLSRFGFTDPRHAFSVLQTLAFGAFPHLLDRDTRAAFQRLLPLLLDEVARSADPNRSLVNFSTLVASAKNVRAFYDRLGESSPFRGMMMDIVASSPELTRAVARNFAAVDTLHDTATDDREADELLEHDWRLLSGGARRSEAESAYSRIRGLVDRRTLAAWVQDIDAGTFPMRLVKARASIIRQVIVTAYDQLFAGQSGVALFAMGSFGAGEPRFGSDLDLLVVTMGDDMERITRSVQALHRLVSDGGVIKLDFRLRGEGANAPLVQDLAYYQGYFARRMSPWERVAFAKCAFWAGDGKLGDEFVDVLLPHLVGKPDRAAVDVLKSTRDKLERLAPKAAEPLETKRSAGGRYDIEYICALGLAVRAKPFSLDADSRTRLGLLVDAGILSGEMSERLRSALDFYDRVDYLLELGGPPLPATPAAVRTALAGLDRTFVRLGLATGGGLESTLRKHKAAVRDSYTWLMNEVLVP